MGEREHVTVYGYKNKESQKSVQHFKCIQVRDLELDKKYKIITLHTFERKGMRVGKIGIEIHLDGGFQVLLPDRFKAMAEFIKLKKPENVFMSYAGRGKRNAYIIQFFDDDKLIELDSY